LKGHLTRILELVGIEPFAVHTYQAKNNKESVYVRTTISTHKNESVLTRLIVRLVGSGKRGLPDTWVLLCSGSRVPTRPTTTTQGRKKELISKKILDDYVGD